VSSLDPLFHWSPSTNRMEILREGLKPYAVPTAHGPDLVYPYICLSPTPSAGWGLSGDIDIVGDIEEWDLWQVRVSSDDRVNVVDCIGPYPQEVRVRNAIPADRIWWVAQRTPFAAETMGEYLKRKVTE
jgi:hypothetical protein